MAIWLKGDTGKREAKMTEIEQNFEVMDGKLV